ncbi:MAG: hypothetical protein ACI3Z5_01410 [Paludibacteraceae bacterium]
MPNHSVLIYIGLSILHRISFLSCSNHVASNYGKKTAKGRQEHGKRTAKAYHLRMLSC